MSDFDIVIADETPEAVAIDVPDPDLYDRVKLDNITDRETFHTYINDVKNFPGQQDHRLRLARGLMHSGSDNPDRGTVVIVFRGTTVSLQDGDVKDLGTDISFLFRNVNQTSLQSSGRYIRNKQFIIEQMNTYFNGQAINGSNSYWDFYVTGHSLGAALSETLSMDRLVHGGYSFSAPVDNITNNYAYSDDSGRRTTRSMNAPTYRSINYYDRVIGATDATTGGDAIYDDVIKGTIISYDKGISEQMAGHNLDQFKGQQYTTPFQIPPYNPDRLQRVILGPQETIRRTGEKLKPITGKVGNFLPSFIKPYIGLGKKRKRRGKGPPPTYPLSLTLAKEAYEKDIATPQKIDAGQQAILCPSPISNQEVKFYVCRWPRFYSDKERDRAIGALVKLLTDTPLKKVEAFEKDYDRSELLSMSQFFGQNEARQGLPSAV